MSSRTLASIIRTIRSLHSTPRVVRIHLTAARGSPAPLPAVSVVNFEELPFIDEHSVDISANPDAVWQATIQMVRRSLAGPRAELMAHLLGCNPSTAMEWSCPAPGCTLAGFRVEAAQPPTLIALTGRHRFSQYALTFRVDELNTGLSRVRAETRASFPARRGQLYRAAVIGSRGHRVLVQRMLCDIKRLAEEAPTSGASA